MAATPTPEQRELQLIDSVEFKILAVLKADSSHASVRVKVRVP
jgi:hypothetical protein